MLVTHGHNGFVTQPLHLQVKLRGFRIELTEIDHNLSTFQGVQQAIAVVHKDAMGQQHLVAYVSPAQTDINRLRTHAGQFLPKHMIPETFVLLDEFPRLPNGKADRNSLPEPKYGDLAEADYAAPVNELEKQVRRLPAFECVFLSACLHLFVCLSGRLSFCLSVCLCVFSVCLSACRPVCLYRCACPLALHMPPCLL